MPLGPNVRVFQGPWARSWAEIKTRFYAGNLVSQGPSGTYGVGWMRRPYRYRQPWAGYPMGCHIGRLTRTRHENWRGLRRPLKFPNLIVSLTRFGHVIEGNVGPTEATCTKGTSRAKRATSQNGVAPFVLPIKLRSGVLEPPRVTPGVLSYTRGSQPIT